MTFSSRVSAMRERIFSLFYVRVLHVQVIHCSIRGKQGVLFGQKVLQLAQLWQLRFFFSNQTSLPVPKDHHQHGKPHEHRFPFWGQC